MKEEDKILENSYTPEEVAKIMHSEQEEMRRRLLKRGFSSLEHYIVKKKPKERIDFPAFSTKGESGITYRVFYTVESYEDYKKGKGLGFTLYVVIPTKKGLGALVCHSMEEQFNPQNYEFYTPHFFGRYAQRRGIEGLSRAGLIDRFFMNRGNASVEEYRFNLKRYPNSVILALEEGGVIFGDKEEGKVFLCRTYISEREFKGKQEELYNTLISRDKEYRSMEGFLRGYFESEEGISKLQEEGLLPLTE